MKIETNKELKIKIKGKDIENFKSAVVKILDENKKVGFKSSILNEDETKIFNEIKNKI